MHVRNSRQATISRRRAASIVNLKTGNVGDARPASSVTRLKDADIAADAMSGHRGWPQDDSFLGSVHSIVPVRAGIAMPDRGAKRPSMIDGIRGLPSVVQRRWLADDRFTPRPSPARRRHSGPDPARGQQQSSRSTSMPSKLDYFDKEQKLVYTGDVVATVQGDSKPEGFDPRRSISCRRTRLTRVPAPLQLHARCSRMEAAGSRDA